MRYPAKIDWWIGLAWGAALLLLLGLAITSASLKGYAVFVAACAVVFGCCYPQSFETTEVCLLVRAGLRTIRIPYSRITGVRPSSDGRSALAMSLDRILVEYESGSILIAPKNQDLFLADIQARAPQLSKRGQNLVTSLL